MTMQQFQNLTDSEKLVIRSLAFSHFIEGTEYNSPVWSNCVNDSSKPSGIEGKSLSGVLSSLSKKKVLRMQGSGPDSMITFTTEAAFNFARTL